MKHTIKIVAEVDDETGEITVKNIKKLGKMQRGQLTGLLMAIIDDLADIHKETCRVYNIRGKKK